MKGKEIRSWKGRVGPLQAEIMHLIFRYGENGMVAGDIFEIMYEKQKLPRSSVYTVLNRLIRRGLLGRKKVSGVYRYYPCVKEEDFGQFGYFEDRVTVRGVPDLVTRLIRRDIAGKIQEIEALQKLLDEERERLKHK